jgi:two-component system LytT family sensor kinase
MPNHTSAWAARWKLWLIGWAAWIGLGLLQAAETVAMMSYAGRSLDWRPLVLTRLADWGTCGLFTPAFFWMTERFPIRRDRWRLNVARHMVASLAFAVCKCALYLPLLRLIAPALKGDYVGLLLANLFPDVLGYWAAVGIIHAIVYYRESREREVETARLDGALRAAELDALRAQLQPHFLFNTLQSISTLIHRDPAAADRMLTSLSDLLRVSLGQVAAQEVPLRDELDFLERYLAIMRVRFGDRLVIAVDVPEDLHLATVPSLVLQPLVENAIRHGMADRDERGRVSIRACRLGQSLRLEVEDDGNGNGGGRGSGIGLGNTRERLSRLYGPNCTLEVMSNVNADAAGLTARLTLPLRFGQVAEAIA